MTDIERSSALWEADADAMAASLALHDELIERAAEAHGGRLLKTKGEGDSTLSVFPRASDALECAAALRESLAAVTWPGDLDLRVRVALHTGEAHERGGDYFGPALNRAARLRGLADGGTTLLSQATRELVHDRLPARHGARGPGHPRAARPGAAGAGVRAARGRRRRARAGRAANDPQDRHGPVRRLLDGPGEELDAEARRRFGAQALAGARTVLERHGATVDDYPGDVVMAVFGVPLLHEDDALRAVRAAAELRRTHPRRTRIGVATGEVIAERGPGRAPPAAGDAVNDAKRLQEQAGPDEIAVDAATRRLVRDSVAFEPGPGESFFVAAVHPGDTRARAFTSPLIGRRPQLRALEAAFEAATSDRGCHLVTVLGTAGVGKSRLVEEFTGSLGDRATVLRGRCLPYGEGITYWPLNEVVRDLAGGGRQRRARGGARRAGRAARRRPQGGSRRGRARAGGRARRLGRVSGGEDPAGPRAGCSSCSPSAARSWSCSTTCSGRRPPSSTWSSTWRTSTRDAPVLLLCLARPELLDTAAAGPAGS